MSRAPHVGASVGVVNLDEHGGNPYLSCLVDALGDRGVASTSVRLRPMAVLRARRAGRSVIHVHWPEYLVVRPRGGRRETVRATVDFARMVAAVVLVRATRGRLAWTVHNPGPHNREAHWVSRGAYAVMGRFADAFIAHSRDAARRGAERYPRMEGRTTVAPHGNYSGAYADAPTDARAQVRERFGIPADATVMVAFGQVRAYKRLDQLVGLVTALERDDIHLLIVGAPVEAAHADEVRRLAGDDPRIHLDLRRIPDDEVSSFYAASDCAVLHYTEVFSSGALLLSLSCGVPAISPRSAAAGEVAGPPALEMYEGGDFVTAIEALQAVPVAERRAAALAAAARATWSGSAEAHLRAYAGH